MSVDKPEWNMTTGTIVLVALVGGLAGALAGFLFAQQREKDLRHSLRRKLKNSNQCTENFPQTKKPRYITLNNPKITH